MLKFKNQEQICRVCKKTINEIVQKYERQGEHKIMRELHTTLTKSFERS